MADTNLDQVTVASCPGSFREEGKEPGYKARVTIEPSLPQRVEGSLPWVALSRGWEEGCDPSAPPGPGDTHMHGPCTAQPNICLNNNTREK